MARGNLAKNQVIDKLAAAFGADYLGEVDKKHYVLADDGGETVQIAITLTCPKNPIPIGEKSSVEKSSSVEFINFEEPKVEMTQAERDKIAELKERLGF